MIDAFIDTLETFPRGLVFVGLGLIILVIAKLARDVITPYRIDDEVAKKKNRFSYIMEEIDEST